MQRKFLLKSKHKINMNKNLYYDVIIIGAGSAGLATALHLTELNSNLKIALLSKGDLHEGCTMQAQGGIAAVHEPYENDNFASHIEDTLIAGDGLCDKDVVEFVVESGPDAINWLIDQGVQFNSDLTREGGHSHRRIWHAVDATGREVATKLIKQVQKKSNITILTEHTAIDLILANKLDEKKRHVNGLYALNNKTNKVETLQAKNIVLATGGASKVYLYTTNPDSSSGDGIAMAHRAGCKIANMEFNQFHPTCLYHPEAKSFLISEAVRGEGGILLLPNGKRFMPKFDKRGELAPRDIVARAIDHEMKRFGLDNVFLDISFKGKKFIKEHFPTIYQKCLEFGIDITKEPIPVVPAAHYTCGGVVTDKEGKTNIAGLYAVGEVSCTGLHGANRLASNSILECLVFAKAASITINREIKDFSILKNVPLWDESKVTDSDEEIVVSHNWNELRQLMWNYVGIVRTNKRLERAQMRIDLLKAEIHEYYGNFRVTKNLLELRHLVVVADLIVQAAIKRKQNCGLHYNLDNL